VAVRPITGRVVRERRWRPRDACEGGVQWPGDRPREQGGDFAHLWAWEPFVPRDVAGIMSGFPEPWWACGGWALDLFVGRETRRHDDLDVAILRRDQHALHSYLHPHP
jgi:hypothetical protein